MNKWKGISQRALNHDGSVDWEYELYAKKMQERYDEHVIHNMNTNYEHNYHQFYRVQEPRLVEK